MPREGVQTEKALALQVAQYLQLQFPNVIYRFDLAADLKLTFGQAARHKNMHPHRGFPDLAILQPRFGYHGLFIEMKVGGTRIFKRDGSPASEHIKEQLDYISQLNALGYKATIGVGFQEIVEIITSYLTTKPPDPQTA